MTLIRVDLPAPFSPTSACTSPGSSRKETLSRARTPGNLLVTSRASRTGACSFIDRVSSPLVGRVYVLLGVALVEEAVLEDDLLRYRLAFKELVDGVERQGTEARVGLHCGAELAVDDRLQGVAGAVDRDYGDVLARRLAGGLERLDRADRHLVVVRVDGVYIRVGLDQLLHDLLAAGAREVAALGGDDLHSGLVPYGVAEALGAVVGDRGPDGALELGDLRLAVGRLDEPVAGPLALLYEVGAQEGNVLFADLTARLAVYEEDGHVGPVGGVECRGEPLELARGEDEDVYALGDHVLHVGDLLGRLGLGVGGYVLAGALCALGLHRLSLRDPPGVVVLGLGEPDCGLLEGNVGRLDVAGLAAGGLGARLHLLLALFPTAPGSLVLGVGPRRLARRREQHQAQHNDDPQALASGHHYRFSLS